MRKKLLVGATLSMLLLAGLGGAALALGPWGEATQKPPCAEWRDRVFDKKTGKIKLPGYDDDGNPVGFSLSAARGLLDEGGCKWVFRPSGDKKNVYWNKRYRLEALYDVGVAVWAADAYRTHGFRGLVHIANSDDEKIVTYDERCVEDDGAIRINRLSGMVYCNFPSPDEDDEDLGGLYPEHGDYPIRGPR